MRVSMKEIWRNLDHPLKNKDTKKIMFDLSATLPLAGLSFPHPKATNTRLGAAERSGSVFIKVYDHHIGR